MLGSIVGCVNALGNFFLGALRISYQCGALIVSSGLAVFRTIASIVSTLAEVASILYQDFCVFSYDLLSKLVDLVSICIYLVSGLFSGVKNTFLITRDAILYVVYSFTDVLNLGFNTVSQVIINKMVFK